MTDDIDPEAELLDAVTEEHLAERSKRTAKPRVAPGPRRQTGYTGR
jgi:hypothetical protein